MTAGADGFLTKPVESLATFQQSILSILPRAEGPVPPRIVPKDVIEPDEIAFQDDLSHAAALMRKDADEGMQDYIAQFLGVLARSAHDNSLEAAASSLAQARAEGRTTGQDWARVEGLVQDRLARRVAL